MKFQTVSKSDTSFSVLDQALAAAANKIRTEIDYNAIAEHINGMAVGDITQFPLAAKRVKAVVDQLSKRGLSRGTDYTIGVVDAAEEGEAPQETALLKRLSDAVGTTIAVQRGRPPRAA